MSEHFFLMSPVRAEARWQEALGEVRIVSLMTEVIAKAKAEDLIWVEATRRRELAQMREARPELAFIVLSLNPGEAEGMAALEAGAHGYCHALAAPDMLRQVAMVVANGGLWVGADLMNRVALAVARKAAPLVQSNTHRPLKDLTLREQDVALQVASGASNKEIARSLNITPRTVKAHMGAIFEKYGVRDRLQLVVHLKGVREQDGT